MSIHKRHLAAQIGVLAPLTSSTQRRYASGVNLAAALIWTTIYHF